MGGERSDGLARVREAPRPHRLPNAADGNGKSEEERNGHVAAVTDIILVQPHHSGTVIRWLELGSSNKTARTFASFKLQQDEPPVHPGQIMS